MTNQSNVNGGRARPRGFIRAPQDFYGGLVLIGLAVFSMYAGYDLSGMQGFSFGPGTAPRLFAWMLVGFGVIIVLMGVINPGPKVERWYWRGIILTIASIICFALTIRSLGLIPSSFISFMIGAAATDEVKWGQSAIVGAALTAGCAILFPYILNLPFQLWPQF
ncbi:MAG: tripartite tricarboxylate transporter TctB family protein [Rhizobiales bacterium]|nr:tripartite tricarboxylate transporter TctB family protein [Hyphomicrobiales bacterium]